MKLLHTSDWHVEAPCARLGPSAQPVREARWRAVERVVEVAQEHDVSLVLVAGDTFDSVDADDATVARTVELLDRLAPARVVLLPGNHDPLAAGGVWDRPAWSGLGEHVLVADEAEELVLELDGTEVALYPCPVSQKQSRRDPTEWIPTRSEDDPRLRIGLAHGSSDAMAKAENFPVAQDRAPLAGLDYLALGDWHGQRVFAGQRTAYPGTPEGMSFGESRPGSVLLVELDDGRAQAPRIEPVRVGSLAWLSREVTLHDATDLAELEAELLALGEPERALVRLQVQVVQAEGEAGTVRQTSLLSSVSGADGDASSGEAPKSLVTAVDEFERKWRERLLHLEWSLDELTVGADDLPPALGEIDETLHRALDGGALPDELEDLAEVDPAVLREARWQLRMLAAETAE